MSKPLSLLFVSLLLPAAAPAVDAQTKADIRCLTAISSLMASENPAIKQAGAIGFQYFLGRVDGRAPGLDLEAAIAAEAKAMTEEEKKALLRSCGALLQERGAEVEAIGKRLTARGI